MTKKEFDAMTTLALKYRFCIHGIDRADQCHACWKTLKARAKKK